jgi:hypothetical protein
MVAVSFMLMHNSSMVGACRSLWEAGQGRAGQGRAGQGRAGHGDLGLVRCLGKHEHSCMIQQQQQQQQQVGMAA